MKSNYSLLALLLCAGILSGACENEKTEKYEPGDDPAFSGFSSGYFTVHENSIGYYDPDSNKVFPDIFKHQNGRDLGNGIFSFLSSYSNFPGVVSIEGENRFEFIEVENFISSGSMALTQPRNIFDHAQYVLVSFGKSKTGGIAIVDRNLQVILDTIHTDNEAGKIFVDENDYYVFSSGGDENDSLIVRLHAPDRYSPAISRIDSIVIGIRPVDCAEVIAGYDNQHDGLAILCLGNKSIPPSIVIFDLISKKVVQTLFFENPDFKPENIFLINYRNMFTPILAAYGNNKLYRIELSNPIVSAVLINKNISSLNQTEKNYIAVSRDTIHAVSYLYSIDFQTLEVLDSIPVEPRAKKIEGNAY